MCSLRILIFEDEPWIALHMESILEDAGHVVVGIASQMGQALKIAAASIPFDLAFMDVDLAGGSNGIETDRRLREEHEVASLFVSASLSDEVRARAAEWKPIGFVPKPFSERDVLSALSIVA